MEVKINKEIREYSESIFFGLNLRQLIFSLLAMGQTLYPHRELICASNSIPPELTAYLKENPTNNLNILLKTEENAALLSECAPFTEAYPVSKHHTIWYLCENGACKAPVTDFSQLRL